MKVIINSAANRIMSSASMTCMTSLTDIFLVIFIRDLESIVGHTSNGQDDITFIGGQSMRFVVYSTGMAYPTLENS
jgi:hypothetical protein